ncbi:unnamed protein product [Cylicocyclus nassatus]|uniref:Uncharacterized protein n=1 Tax=Cylicocyclus nassatus TaxID=53992 RepID=A0AA36H9U3_CYLNA|nr:unnamed protein product [Cylicocyclus nassatus]
MSLRHVQGFLRKAPLTMHLLRMKTLTSRFPAVAVSKGPFHEKVMDAMREHAENPSKIALICGDGRAENLTYKELLYQTEAAASYLFRGGFGRDEVACLVMSNSPAFVISHLAVMKCGGVVTTTDTSVSAEDLEQQISETEASVVFTDEEALDTVLPLAQKYDLKKVICVRSPCATGPLPDGVINFQKLVLGPASEIIPSEDYNSTDIALVPYDTAANGLLVGSMLTHESVSTAADIYKKCMHNMMGHKNYHDISQEQLLFCSSLANIFGLLCMDIALILGFTSVILKDYAHTAFLNALHCYRPRLLIAEPKAIVAALKQPVPEDFNISSLEYVLCSGPVVGKSVRQDFLERFPSVKYMSDGAGQISGAPAALIPNVANKDCSEYGNCVVGTSETKVVCAGKELEENELGEIYVRGPTVMQGYVDDGEPIDADGWFHTGEVGHFDQHDNIFVDGRLDDFINVCGNQVCLNEIEDALLCHPAILDAAVVGTEDQETVSAFVVPFDDALTTDDVKLYIKDRVKESYKQLNGGIEFIEKIPRSPYGHVLRDELASRISRRVKEKEVEVEMNSE